jgi:hypothetical protein
MTLTETPGPALFEADAPVPAHQFPLFGDNADTDL